MTVALVRAKWIVTGVQDRHTPNIISDAALVHKHGKWSPSAPSKRCASAFPKPQSHSIRTTC